MEKVSWVERKTNEVVLIMVDEKRELLNRIAKAKKRWIGHIVRGNGLSKEVIEGRIDGRRPKERKGIGMLSELKEDGHAKMKRRADNRDLTKLDAKKDLSADRTLEIMMIYIYIYIYIYSS